MPWSRYTAEHCGRIAEFVAGANVQSLERLEAEARHNAAPASATRRLERSLEPIARAADGPNVACVVCEMPRKDAE